MDSGCSRHMTRDKSKFSSFSPKDGGSVTFRDNSKGKIIGISNVGKNSSLTIENVLLVDELKHNLLRISQLCDKGFQVFESNYCMIKNSKNDKVLFIAYRDKNVYTIDFDDISFQDVECFATLNKTSWL